MYQYQAHEMGTNALSIAQLSQNYCTVCSGGDDQSLARCILKLQVF